MKRDDILAALPTLTKPELEAIVVAARALLGPSGHDTQTHPEGHLAWLYEALQVTLGAKIPYDRFANTNHGKRFKQYGTEFMTFAERTFPKQMKKKVGGMAIIRLLLNLIIADLRQQGAPISIGVLVTNLSRIPMIFEAAFPGYLENGLAALITKQMGNE